MSSEAATQPENSSPRSGRVKTNGRLSHRTASPAQYIYDTYGKFPGTVPSIFVRCYAHSHRADTAFYDRFFRPGSYLATHKSSVERWLKKIRAQA